MRAQKDVAARLTRVLTRVSGLRRVCDVVLRYAVRVVPGRGAAIAIARPDGRLARIAVRGTRHPGGPPPVRLLITEGEHLVAVMDVEGPVSRRDLSALRTLTAPAALALARERARQQARTATRAAATDPLTGLFNRRIFEMRVAEQLHRAVRDQSPVALLMLDVDDFKRVNDTLGHPAGDALLKDIARQLRQAVRASDVTTRYGGDEFAVLMPGAGESSACRTAERIRRAIAAQEPPAPGKPPVTVSIGVAASQYGMSAAALIQRADEALYAAKREGKNRIAAAPITNMVEPRADFSPREGELVRV